MIHTARAIGTVAGIVATSQRLQVPTLVCGARAFCKGLCGECSARSFVEFRTPAMRMVRCVCAGDPPAEPVTVRSLCAQGDKRRSRLGILGILPPPPHSRGR